MHQLFLKRCVSFSQHSNSHLNRIIIGAVIPYFIILTLGFVEVKKPSQMLATIVNMPCSFSGQLQWKQLEFNSSPLGPTNYLNVPSLKMSVIWPGGRHSSGSLRDAMQIQHFFFLFLSFSFSFPVELKSDHHSWVLTLPISQVL